MSVERARPRVVAHADWSKDNSKRWVAAAVREAGGWRFLHLRRVGSTGSIAERMHVAEHGLPLLAGFDFVIGVPRWWARAVGVERFLDLLPLLGVKAPWQETLSPAVEPGQIALHRPFFPAGTPRKGDKARLLGALGAGSVDELFRRCEQAGAHGGAAQPLFLTMGQRQVGKATISGWRELLIPALGGEAGEQPPFLWPFQGRLSQLLSGPRTVVVETYPARFYRELAPTLSGSKQNRESRATQAQALLMGARLAGLALDGAINRVVENGYGAADLEGLSNDKDGEDPFDAMIGLVGMLLVLARGEEPLPADRGVVELEGWMLGQPADDPIPEVEAAEPAPHDAAAEGDGVEGDDARHARGLERFREFHGDAGDEVLAPLGDLGRYIVDFAFGDLYSRPGLSVRERQLATISMLVVLGHEAQLSGHIRAGLHVGVKPYEIQEIILQSVAYAGFPPAVNALGVLRAVLEE